MSHHGKRRAVAGLAAALAGFVFVGAYHHNVGTTTGWTTGLVATLSGGSNATPQEGDLVLVAVGSAAATNSNTVVTTAGWTEVVDAWYPDSTETNLALYYKVMGATPDVSVSFTSSASVDVQALVYVLRGADASTPLDVAYELAAHGNNGRPDPDPVTPVTAGAAIVVIGASAVAGVNTEFTAAYLTNFVTNAGATDYLSMGVGAFYGWSTGAYDPAKFGGGTTSTFASYLAITLAIRPAT